jgi:flagellar protein FlgJ
MMTPQSFIDTIAPAAKKSAETTNIPASFTIAQAALESGWGNTVQGMNLFGIKADKSWHGETVDIKTHEVVKGVRVAIVAKFRKYDSWLDSINDHARFLLTNPRYHKAFNLTDGIGFTRAVADAGYATDPAYPNKIISIITQHKLLQYDIQTT